MPQQFHLKAPYKPAGDQPKVIKELVAGMLGSAVLNIPSGPSIVLASTIVFIVSLFGFPE